MDWTLLQSLWDWLLPAGWLATAIAWWRDRKVYQVRAVKETEGTYKTLYDDLSATVLEISKQLQNKTKEILTMKRLYANYILASMLTAVLSLSSCASSRKASSETVRSDSLRTSVTEQTTYEPVPKRTATCSVSAEQWLNLSKLPAGFGLSYRNDGLNIDIQSDGEGGVNVTATADSTGRQVTVTRTETDHRIRDETVSNEVKETRPGAQGWLTGTALTLLGIFLIWQLIKRYLKHD